MNLRYAFAVIPLLVLSATAACAGTSFEREFTFNADQVHLDAHDGVTVVRVDGAVPSVDAGRPELPWLPEFVDLPQGMQVASVQVVEFAFEPLAIGVRLPSGWTQVAGAPGPARSTPDAWEFARPGAQPAQPVEL